MNSLHLLLNLPRQLPFDPALLARLPAGVTLARPQALYLLAAVGLLLLWWLARADAWRKVPARLMRALMLAALVVALAGPERLSTSEGAVKPVLLDASASITPQARHFAANLAVDQLRLRTNDPALLFAARPISASLGEGLAQLTSAAGCQACEPGHTNLEAALRKLIATGASGPVVLVTDGWENQGEAAAMAGALLAAHLELYIVTPPDPTSLPNVAVSELTMPHAMADADTFSVGVTLSNMNDRPATGSLSLYQNDHLLEQRNLTLAPGAERIEFPVRGIETGLNSYRAVFKAADLAQDLYPQDDSLEGWVGIGARRKLLIFAGQARDATYLQATARRLGLEPETAEPEDTRFNRTLGSFDAIVLDNVPRERMAGATQQALIDYVTHGGALAMVGGDRSFGLGGWHGSGIERIMPVIMQPPQHKEQQRALVLIIDKSGSMGRDNKLTYAKAAARTASTTLKDNDLIEVIGFDSQPFVVVPLEPMKTARPYLDEMIDRLKARGTTYLLPALKEADRDLASSTAAIKHVVILTDGETGGTAAMYYDLVASMHHEEGVTVSSIAIGDQANARLLGQISRFGGGALYQTNSPETLPQITMRDVRQHGGDQTMVESRTSQFVPQAVNPDAVLKALAGRRFPPIAGYVRTQLKPGARLDVYVTRDGKREPIIASTRYGAGKTLAITTDGGGRWATQWIRDELFGTLWDRMLAWMSPPPTNVAKFDVAMGYRDGRIALKLTDYSPGTARAFSLLEAQITRPDNSREELSFSEGVPGELSGSFSAPRPGTYYIQLRTPHASAKDHPLPPLAYTVSPAAEAELPRAHPNYDLLEGLAAATGGRLNPPPADIVLARPHLLSSVSLNRPLLLAAMLLLLCEALLRRLTE